MILTSHQYVLDDVNKPFIICADMEACVWDPSTRKDRQRISVFSSYLCAEQLSLRSVFFKKTFFPKNEHVRGVI